MNVDDEKLWMAEEIPRRMDREAVDPMGAALARPIQDVSMTARTVLWFSCGAASAVAAKLVLAEQGHSNVEIVYTDTGSEHEDNARFLRDAQAWFGHEVQIRKSGKYEDTWQVWEDTRFLVGPFGARCTGELKKKVRFAFQRPDDIQTFGFTADPREKKRAERFREQNPEVNLRTPLIERGITKADCLGILDAVGIQLPVMYRMGYQNNNCIGCVKGGAGYWNKIRRDFPDVFDRMADLEQRIGATVLRRNGKRLPLVHLDPNAGRYADEPDIECGLLCSATADYVTEDAVHQDHMNEKESELCSRCGDPITNTNASDKASDDLCRDCHHEKDSMNNSTD